MCNIICYYSQDVCVFLPSSFIRTCLFLILQVTSKLNIFQVFLSRLIAFPWLNIVFLFFNKGPPIPWSFNRFTFRTKEGPWGESSPTQNVFGVWKTDLFSRRWEIIPSTSKQHVKMYVIVCPFEAILVTWSWDMTEVGVNRYTGVIRGMWPSVDPQWTGFSI